MAKITIEELYRGEKYDIMSAVAVKAMTLGIDERTEDGRTWIEMELVRQTIVAMLKLNQNGDCISDKELGDTVAVSIADEIIEKEYHLDRELGITLRAAIKYSLEHDNIDAAEIVNCVMYFIKHIDTYSLLGIQEIISKRTKITVLEKAWLNGCWDALQNLIGHEINRRTKS